MRLTNTITLRSHSKDLQDNLDLKQRLIEHYSKKVSFEQETLRQQGFDDIHVLTAKLYNQPPQKAFIHDLNLFLENKQELLDEADRHLDSHNTFFFRIDKQSFFTDSWRFVHSGDVIQVRINLSAHPKTRENALEKVSEMLA